MMTSGFRFYKPCQQLRDYIRYYWIFESNQPIEAYTFPIGCPQIIFHKKSALYIPELSTKQDKLTISGQVNFSSHISATDNIEMIVAVFHPYAMSSFLNVPASLFYNREVSGYGLENKDLNCLAARVLDCEDNNFCIYLIEQWLLSQLRINSTSRREQDIDRIMTVIRQMYSNPNIRISELASIACLGKKQFERVFLAMVGMNPKEYARIVRFQKSLKLMQNQPESLSLAQIAYQCGYSDQSHFIREFRTLSGYTPLSLREICEPYSDLFTTPL